MHFPLFSFPTLQTVCMLILLGDLLLVSASSRWWLRALGFLAGSHARSSSTLAPAHSSPYRRLCCLLLLAGGRV
jgi:hypothetical protein